MGEREKPRRKTEVNSKVLHPTEMTYLRSSGGCFAMRRVIISNSSAHRRRRVDDVTASARKKQIAIALSNFRGASRNLDRRRRSADSASSRARAHSSPSPILFSYVVVFRRAEIASRRLPFATRISSTALCYSRKRIGKTFPAIDSITLRFCVHTASIVFFLRARYLLSSSSTNDGVFRRILPRASIGDFIFNIYSLNSAKCHLTLSKNIIITNLINSIPRLRGTEIVGLLFV